MEINLYKIYSRAFFQFCIDPYSVKSKFTRMKFRSNEQLLMYGNYISYTCSNKLHVAKSKLGIAVFNLELARARKSFHLVCKTHKKKIRTNTANIEMIALTIYRINVCYFYFCNNYRCTQNFVSSRYVGSNEYQNSCSGLYLRKCSL